MWLAFILRVDGAKRGTHARFWWELAVRGDNFALTSDGTNSTDFIPTEVTGKARVEAEEEAGREEESEGEPKQEVEAPTQAGVPAASATASSLARLPKARHQHNGADSMAAEAARNDLSQEVASILGRACTAGLRRLVALDQMSPRLSLLGKADAACEEIESPQRTWRGQAMSLTFFRRWLQCDQEIILSRQAALVSSHSFVCELAVNVDRDVDRDLLT